MYENSELNNDATQYSQYNQQYPQNTQNQQYPQNTQNQQYPQNTQNQQYQPAQQYQPYKQQPMYAPQQYNQYIQVAQPTESNPVSVGDWMLTTLLLCIPIVNIILIFVWAFGGTAPKSKENFFKAYLIWTAIGIGIALFYFLVILTLLGGF